MPDYRNQSIINETTKTNEGLSIVAKLNTTTCFWNDTTTFYPFSQVMRLRVLQIVCGTCILVLGAVAWIDDHYSFLGLDLGVPAGLLTVLASGCCIYRSRGFGGYHPSSCKDSCFRFMGANTQVACPLVALWSIACTLHLLVAIQAVRVIQGSDNYSDTMFILSMIELVLSTLTLVAVVWTIRIDICYDPDRPEALGGEIRGSGTGMSFVPIASSSSERGVTERTEI